MECMRTTMVLKSKGIGLLGLVAGSKSSHVTTFTKNILAAFPGVSMSLPYLETFSNVVRENHKISGVGKGEDDVDMLKAGMTGIPTVDASMWCINAMGWVGVE
jgi:deoxyribodipyrimidine photo-lyase